MRSARRHRARPRIVVRRLVIAAGLAALVACCWLGVRALSAQEALRDAEALLGEIRAGISDPTTDLGGTLRQLSARTADAVDATRDPVWRIAEGIPWLGPNLVAVREVAEAASGLTVEVVSPLVRARGEWGVDMLLPTHGRVDLDGIRVAQPTLRTTADAARSIDGRLRSVDVTALAPFVEHAFRSVRADIEELSSQLAFIADAAETLPDVLGGDGARTYLLMVLNNAELRASGGIPGVLVEIHASDGRLSLGASSGGFSFPEEAVAITEQERTLFGAQFPRYIQNTTMTPAFERSGEMAQEMWHKRTGRKVDGVLSVDPMALAAVLDVTGPIALADGSVLDARTVADTLLRDVYARLENRAEHDAYFEMAAAQIFARMVEGVADPRGLLEAIAGSVADRRILAWSARPDEQRVVASSAMDGALPVASGTLTELGVYFFDNTEGKMGYYLRAETEALSAVCRVDGRVDIELTVRMRSTAPADAAVSLPPAVLGGRHGLGVVPGDIRTTVFLFAPAGSVVFDVLERGASRAFIGSAYGSHEVAGATTSLSPGSSTEVTFRMLTPPGSATALHVETTPMVSEVPIRLGALQSCPETDRPGTIFASGGAATTPPGAERARVRRRTDDRRHSVRRRDPNVGGSPNQRSVPSFPRSGDRII